MNRIEEAKGRLHNIRVTLEGAAHDLQNTEALLGFELADEEKDVPFETPEETAQTSKRQDETAATLEAAAMIERQEPPETPYDLDYVPITKPEELLASALQQQIRTENLLDQLENQLFPMVERRVSNYIAEFEITDLAAAVANLLRPEDRA